MQLFYRFLIFYILLVAAILTLCINRPFGLLKLNAEANELH